MIIWKSSQEEMPPDDVSVLLFLHNDLTVGWVEARGRWIWYADGERVIDLEHCPPFWWTHLPDPPEEAP